MKLTDNSICLAAFNALCDELSASKISDLEECQCWIIERVYKAAVEELINNISIAAQSAHPVLLKQKYLTKETAVH